MDRWWPPLLAALPPAVWFALKLSLPPWTWAIGALLLLAVYGGVYRTQVPLFLSRREVWEAVLGLLPAPRGDAATPVRLVDLGSGLGALPRFIGRARPTSRPWASSWRRCPRWSRPSGSAGRRCRT